MRYARALGFGNIHYRIDATSGLHAIVAIHNIKRGPAIGGCRFYPYHSYSHAFKDVLRLASMMTIKNAACALPHGGAKAVVIKPAGAFDRKKLFNAFGDFVHELNGDYITAMDVGTTNADMDSIAERTPHVIGANLNDPMHGDPSPYTATGIFRGIQAAVKFKYHRDSLSGLTVAIQGAGKVGYHLAAQLHASGVKIIACDTHFEATQALVTAFNATIVKPEAIYDQDCDIFSPCALGGTLTLENAVKIKAAIIAGAANNQLSHRKVGHILHHRNILYLPDFIVNAGGVIQAASVHDYHDVEIANKKIDQLYDQLYSIFQRAEAANQPTIDIAYQIAIENLN